MKEFPIKKDMKRRETEGEEDQDPELHPKGGAMVC